MTKGNMQVCLTNNFDSQTSYYEFIEVERSIRYQQADFQQVYFLVLFACCSEEYAPAKHKGINAGANVVDLLKLEKSVTPNIQHNWYDRPVVLNMTMLYGSKGVDANPNFIGEFIRHLMMWFDPVIGQVRIPECFG